MSITKEEFISQFQEELNSNLKIQNLILTKKNVKTIYELLISHIVKSLTEKEEFKLYGLGRFFTKKIKVGLPEGHSFLKPGQTPNQREEKTIKFKSSSTSRNLIN